MNNNGETPHVDAAARPKPPPNAWTIAGAVLAVICSSVIAFCCTCFPVGMAIAEYGGGVIVYEPAEEIRRVNPLLVYAWIAGGIVAILIGYFVFRRIRKSWRNH